MPVENKQIDRSIPQTTGEAAPAEAIDLSDDYLFSVRQKMLRLIIDNTITISKSFLRKKEAVVLSGILQGKNLSTIASEIGNTKERVRQIAHKSVDKLMPWLDFTSLRNENLQLHEANEALVKKVEFLEERVRELKMHRTVLGSPLGKDIKLLGLSNHTLMGLSRLGCKTVADLVEFDETTILKTRKLGLSSLTMIKEKLGEMGLHLGMHIDSMSDWEFYDLIEKIS